MQLFSTKELEGTTIKKEGVLVQFSVSLCQDLLLLFCAKYVMEETALPSATLESNTEIGSDTSDGTFSPPQQPKRRKEDWREVKRFATR